MYRILLAFPVLFIALTLSLFSTHAYATTVIVHNDATVHTENNTSANSGDNTTTNNNSSTTIIHTGDANAQGVIINNVNTNIIKTNCNCTPTPTFSPISPTPIPTSTPNNGGGSNGGGNGGGGSSSGSSNSSSPTQAVLGVSTLGATGTFTENMMNWMAIVGLGFLTLGLFNKLKSKSFALEFEFSF